MKAGEWLGPWVLCHTLEAVMKKMEPASLSIHVHVVSQPGGAVPVLYTARYPPPYPSTLQRVNDWADAAAGCVLFHQLWAFCTCKRPHVSGMKA